MFVASNYSAILDRIAAPVRASATILLGQYAERISTSHASPGTPHVSKITVQTRSGKSFVFDQVVVTCPLGWLKKNLQVFNPPLPDKLQNAVGNLGLSQLEKVFITFPRAYWRSNGDEAANPCYTNWLTPEYAGDTNPKHWPQEIWDLSVFDPPNQHATMLFYLYGDCSRHIVDMIHGKSTQDKYALLDAFFKPYYSRLPGYLEADQDCTPRAILATEWYKDDLCGNGSYCNFQVGIEEADKDVLAFRDGCPERGLWFCGEHAAPFEECGTVAGAYLSGEHAAGNVVRVLDERARRQDEEHMTGLDGQT
jgi:hypothetical protein